MFFSSKNKNLPKPEWAGKTELASAEQALKQLLKQADVRVFGSTKAAEATGYALTGNRSALFTYNGSSNLDSLLKQFPQNVPLLLFVEEREESGSTPFNTRNDLIQLQAGTSQELLDYALLGLRISAQLLQPVSIHYAADICVNTITHLNRVSTQFISLFMESEIENKINPIHSVLYGKNRATHPALIDATQPIGISVSKNSTEQFKHNLFSSHAPQSDSINFINNCFQYWAEKTGRAYSIWNSVNAKKANHVIIAPAELHSQFVQLLPQLKKARTAVIFPALLAPLDGAALKTFVKGKSALTLLSKGLQPHPLEKSLTELALELATEKQPINLIKGVYNAATLHLSDLNAVIKNMEKSEPINPFFSALGAEADVKRFPTLEIKKQYLATHFPNLEKSRLAPIPLPEQKNEPTLHKTILQLGSLYNNESYSSFFLPFLNLENFGFIHSQKIDAHALALTLGKENPPSPQFPEKADVVLWMDPDHEPDLSYVNNQASILISNTYPLEEMWENLSNEVRTQIETKSLNIFSINPLKVMHDIEMLPTTKDELSLVLFFGSWLKLNSEKFEHFLDESVLRIKTWLQKQDTFESHIELLLSALKLGYENIEKLSWDSLPQLTSLKEKETPTPWTVKKVENPETSIFDLAHHWNSVGYFYQNGLAHLTQKDPLAASDTMPARSSAFNSFTHTYTRMARLIPEKFSDKNKAWALCPDSALPLTLFSTKELIETAINAAEQEGAKLVQFKRISGNLAKQAHRLFKEDALQRYLRADLLMQEAFEQLLGKMKPDEEAKKVLFNEFNLVLQQINTLPLVRSEQFFNTRETANKGSGLLASVAVSAANCKACGLCAKGENAAFEMVTRSDTILENSIKNAAFFKKLPTRNMHELKPFIQTELEQDRLNMLLHQSAYFSLPGGDTALPGNGFKLNIRLVSSFLEAKMRMRFERLSNEIEAMKELLQKRIQGDINQSVKINTFDAFNKQISELEGKDFSKGAFFNLVNEMENPSSLEVEFIKKLSALHAQLSTLQKELKHGKNGNGLAPFSMVLNLSDEQKWATEYPYNPFSVPWVNVREGDATGMALGLFDGALNHTKQIFTTLRKAELYLSNAYNEKVHKSFFKSFAWETFSAEERKYVPPVVVVLDATKKQALTVANLLRLINSGKPIYIILLNAMQAEYNNSVMATMLAALSQKKGHILQSNAAYSSHLFKHLHTVTKSGEAALIHLYSADPLMQGITPDMVLEHYKQATETRAFPLFYLNPSHSEFFTECLDISENPAMEEDWFNSGEMVQHYCHWALLEKKFNPHFKVVAKRNWDDDMVPLESYLQKTEDEKGYLKAYFNFKATNGTEYRVLPSQFMIEQTAQALEQWRLLQELAGTRLKERAVQKEKMEKAISKALDAQKQALEADYNATINQIKLEHWQTYHGQLKDRLSAIYRAQKGETPSGTLADYLEK